MQRVCEYLKGQRSLDSIRDSSTVQKASAVLERVENRRQATPFLEEGNAHWLKGEWSAAQAAYQKALEIFPGFPEAHVGLGKVYTEQGREDSATTQFKRAIALDPGQWLEAAQTLKQATRHSGRQKPWNPKGRYDRRRGLKMNQRLFIRAAGGIFWVIAFLHALRLIFRWQAVIGGWTVPHGVSLVAVAVFGYLGWAGLRAKS